jgi:hypothetical protein
LVDASGVQPSIRQGGGGDDIGHIGDDDNAAGRLASIRAIEDRATGLSRPVTRRWPEEGTMEV